MTFCNLIPQRFLTPALALGFTALVAAPQAAHAAAITWLTPVNETGAASDILTTGSLVGAATAGSTTTVNGVTFIGTTATTTGGVSSFGSSGITLSNVLSPYLLPPNAVQSGFSANYNALISGGAYNTSANGMTLNLSGLTTGSIYTIQIFEAFWNTNYATAFTGGGLTSGILNLAGPDAGAGASSIAQYVIGSFVADSTSEAITLSSPTPYVIFDAAQVRGPTVNTASAVPEPASLALLAVGLGGAALVRRRAKAR